jgi:hypothetical protein
MSGGSWERDGRPWCATISLTSRVGTLLLKTATAEDASSSGEMACLGVIFVGICKSQNAQFPSSGNGMPNLVFLARFSEFKQVFVII